jgi:NAD(P)-dependent dehydrogenase (short-subunit alcohol dehydrogenase family)
MLRQTPGEKRLAEPEEISYAVGMLCEDRARWMNGTFIHVNGGLFID